MQIQIVYTRRRVRWSLHGNPEGSILEWPDISDLIIEQRVRDEPRAAVQL